MDVRMKIYVEDRVDALANEGAVRHEFAVNAVEDRLEVIALTWILRVEEVEESHEKVLRNVPLDDLWVGLVRDDKTEEELIHVLQMRPGGFEDRLHSKQGGGRKGSSIVGLRCAVASYLVLVGIILSMWRRVIRRETPE